MDFKEYIIKRNKSKIEVFYTVLLYLLASVISVFVLLLLFNPMLGGIWLLLIVGVFFGAHKLSTKFNREYEYIITKDIVDIDVIYNAASRKRLISFSVHEVEEIAPAKDKDTADDRGYSKVINATTNTKGAKIYSVVLEKEGKVLIKFEPPFSMLEIMKKLETRKVVINE